MNIAKLKDTLDKYSVEELVTIGLQTFYHKEEVDYNILIKWYQEEMFNELHNDIDYFIDSIQDIKENWEHYEDVYALLNDDASKNTYLGMLYAKVFMNPKYIEEVYSNTVPYFSKQLWGELGNEFYVDCGAYIGDTVLKFANICPWYQKIIAFEAVPETAGKCQEELQYLIENENVQVLNYAVSDSNKELHFALGDQDESSRKSDAGDLLVQAISLDEIISDPVTFIKMDIEGSEKEALLGAKNIIKRYTPKLAICIYHLKDDFWKIPELILSINNAYDFMIRQHDCEVYSETVLYCIPKKEKIHTFIDSDTAFRRIQAVNEKLIILDSGEAKNYIDHIKAKKWFLSQLRGYRQDCSEKQKIIQELQGWIKELEHGKAWLEKHAEEQERYIQILQEKIEICSTTEETMKSQV